MLQILGIIEERFFIWRNNLRQRFQIWKSEKDSLEISKTDISHCEWYFASFILSRTRFACSSRIGLQSWLFLQKILPYYTLHINWEKVKNYFLSKNMPLYTLNNTCNRWSISSFNRYYLLNLFLALTPLVYDIYFWIHHCGTTLL